MVCLFKCNGYFFSFNDGGNAVRVSGGSIEICYKSSSASNWKKWTLMNYGSTRTMSHITAGETLITEKFRKLSIAGMTANDCRTGSYYLTNFDFFLYIQLLT